MLWTSFRNPDICNHKSVQSTNPKANGQDAMTNASTAAWRMILATNLSSLTKDWNLVCLSSGREA